MLASFGFLFFFFLRIFFRDASFRSFKFLFVCLFSVSWDDLVIEALYCELGYLNSYLMQVLLLESVSLLCWVIAFETNVLSHFYGSGFELNVGQCGIVSSA